MSREVLKALGDQARAILKAITPDKKKDGEAPVPVPPPDPDALPTDTRVEGADASPKKGDLDKAGESQAAAPQPPAGGEGEGEGGAPAPAKPEGGEPDPEGGEPKPEGGEPDPEGGEGEEDEEGGEGRPVKKSFDEFGNRDLGPDEMRQMLKSYGITPPATEDEAAHGGEDVESILASILSALESQNKVISDLKAEVARLQSGNVERDRSIAKALDSLADPRLAPAAPARAITKANAEAQPPAEVLTEAQFATQVFSDVRAGKLTDDQARVKVREFKATPR